MKIAVIGAGVYGTALGGVLEEKGYEISYYDPMLFDVSLKEVLNGAEMALLVVPSGVVPEIVAHLPKDLPLIVATKGILSKAVFADFSDVMVLSGPGFADDIKAHKMTYLTITDKRLKEIFKVDYLGFDETDDVQGVLMCGALKNVYAILAGYLGLLPGSEDYEQFITEVAEEMQALLSANGARPETVNLYCGVGDLRLTCDAPSRNYQYGKHLRENPLYQPEATVEGLTALNKIRAGEIKIPEEALKLKQLMGIIWG